MQTHFEEQLEIIIGVKLEAHTLWNAQCLSHVDALFIVVESMKEQKPHTQQTQSHEHNRPPKGGTHYRKVVCFV